MARTERRLSFPFIPHPVSLINDTILRSLSLVMQASKRFQCHVCERWFCHRGLSQHIRKQRHCRDVIMSRSYRLITMCLTHVRKVVEDLGLSFRTVEELEKIIISNFPASGHPRFECKKRVRSNSAQMFPHVVPANKKTSRRRVRE